MDQTVYTIKQVHHALKDLGHERSMPALREFARQCDLYSNGNLIPESRLPALRSDMWISTHDDIIRAQLEKSRTT